MTPPRAASPGQRTGVLLCAWIWLFYVGTAGGSLTTTDALVTYELTRQMVERGSVALPGDILGQPAHRGADGRYYSPFGLAQSVANVPFFFAGRLVERLGLRLGTPDSLTKAAVAMGNTVVMAATIWLVYLWGWRLTGSVRAGVIVSLLAGVATPLWPYSKFGFNAPLAALGTAAALYLAWRAMHGSPRAALSSGACVGLALLTRHELALLVVPILVALFIAAPDWAAWRRQARQVAIGLAPALGGWLAYNAWRFGHPLDSGYLRDPVPAFGSSVLEGLYGLLLSPGASLLVYCPLALAGIAGLFWNWRRDRALAVLLGGTAATLLVFYAQLGNWMGGRSYGPRYLVPALPLLCVALAPVVAERRRGRALALVAVISLLVQFPGVLVDYSTVSIAHARAAGPPGPGDRLTNWAVSPLILNARAAARLVPANLAWLSGARPRPAAARTDVTRRGEFRQQFADSLDVWWLYLFHMRALPAAGVFAIAAAFLAGLTVLGVALIRSVPADHAGGHAGRNILK